MSAWSWKLKSTKLKIRSSGTKCLPRIHLILIFNMKATVKDETLQARSKMRTNRKFLTSVMKSSTGLIRSRLQRRKNWNISRKSWRKSASRHYQAISECRRHARRDTWGPSWGWSLPSGGASSGATIEEVDSANLSIEVALLHSIKH